MKTEKQAMAGPMAEISENSLQRKKGKSPCPWASKFKAQNFGGFLRRTFSVHCWGDSNNATEEMTRNKRDSLVSAIQHPERVQKGRHTGSLG